MEQSQANNVRRNVVLIGTVIGFFAVIAFTAGRPAVDKLFSGDGAASLSDKQPSELNAK